MSAPLKADDISMCGTATALVHDVRSGGTLALDLVGVTDLTLQDAFVKPWSLFIVYWNKRKSEGSCFSPMERHSRENGVNKGDPHLTCQDVGGERLALPIITGKVWLPREEVTGLQCAPRHTSQMKALTIIHETLWCDFTPSL